MLENEILDYFPEDAKPIIFADETDLVLARHFWDRDELFEIARLFSQNHILFQAISHSEDSLSNYSFEQHWNNHHPVELYIKEEDINNAKEILEDFDLQYQERNRNQKEVFDSNNRTNSIPFLILIFVLFIIFLILLFIYQIKIYEE